MTFCDENRLLRLGRGHICNSGYPTSGCLIVGGRHNQLL